MIRNKANLFVFGLLINSALFGNNDLTTEERIFIDSHCPPSNITKKLDTIFSKFPSELNLLLAGQIPQKTKQELKDLFQKEGFEVLVL